MRSFTTSRTIAEYNNYKGVGVFTVIPGYICPSDSNGRTPGYTNGVGNGARSSILTCRGDFVLRNEWTTGSITTAADPNGRTRLENYLEGRTRAPFPLGQWNTMAHFIDGTSNTMAISETVSSYDTSDRNVKSGMITNWPSASSTVMGVTPAECLKARNPNDKTQLVAVTSLSRRGALMGAGRYLYNGFSAILPPNSPSCNPNASIDAGFCLASATSDHTGGVNIGMFDGSVRFTSDTINTNGSSLEPVRIGASVFGVWGALGSINGGESVSF